MKITDLQCQIKLHFAYVISCFYKWKLPTDFPYLKALVVNFEGTMALEA